ncbi:MAG: M20/M25/M40 family metallo-hydrolase [Candidatus Krumholzibacteriia bacterium]
MNAAVLLLAAAIGPVPRAAAAAAAPAPAALPQRVATLTAPAFAGRGAGAAEGAALADTLAAWLAAAQLVPAFGGAWVQPFPLRGEGWAGQDLTGLPGRNVAGLRPGHGRLAGRWIILGAHHDHLGRVDPQGPDAAGPPAPGAYYPGANDNASGVAAVLAAAAALADAPAGDRRGLLVVLFDGEEVGLQGSGHFVDHCPVPLDSVDAMINLDTVGRLQDGTLHVSGVGTAACLPPVVGAADGGEFAVRTAQGGWSGSDHMVFNTREVPVLFLFGGAYPDYNRPSDTAGTLDPAALAAVARYAERLVAGLLVAPSPCAWAMVGDGPLRSEGGSQEGQNRATWLGTLPDFSEETTGYRLAGVFDHSPARQAGLQKGDVLVRLGGREVTDLATFTRALRAHAPGDPVEVEVRRGGRLLRFTVVMGDRADRR